MQPPLLTVAASITYGCSLHSIRLQARLEEGLLEAGDELFLLALLAGELGHLPAQLVEQQGLWGGARPVGENIDSELKAQARRRVKTKQKVARWVLGGLSDAVGCQ